MASIAFNPYIPSFYDDYGRLLSELSPYFDMASYTPRMFTVPEDYRTAITAYDTLTRQIHIAEGACFWGYTFSTLTTASNVSSYQVQVIDPSRDSIVWSSYISGTGLASLNQAKRQPSLLTSPVLMGGCRLLDVRIANLSGSDLQCQLLMMFSEPRGPVASST